MELGKMIFFKDKELKQKKIKKNLQDNLKMINLTEKEKYFMMMEYK